MTSRELIEALEEAGFKPRSYSGRFMYGKHCVAVACDSAWQLAKSLGDVNVIEPNSDHLGLGMIFYWPRYEWPEDCDEEEEEEEYPADASSLLDPEREKKRKER